MKDVKNNEVIDLFREELNKKQKTEEKKIAKMRVKEKKRENKKLKNLEKLEDLEFSRQIRFNNKSDIKKEKYYILNSLIFIFSLFLLIIGIDYFTFNIIKGNDLEQIITSSILCLMIIFYLLSIIIKNGRIKKWLEIISILFITLYMFYNLYII